MPVGNGYFQPSLGVERLSCLFWKCRQEVSAFYLCSAERKPNFCSAQRCPEKGPPAGCRCCPGGGRHLAGEGGGRPAHGIFLRVWVPWAWGGPPPPPLLRGWGRGQRPGREPLRKTSEPGNQKRCRRGLRGSRIPDHEGSWEGSAVRLSVRLSGVALRPGWRLAARPGAVGSWPASPPAALGQPAAAQGLRLAGTRWGRVPAGKPQPSPPRSPTWQGGLGRRVPVRGCCPRKGPTAQPGRGAPACWESAGARKGKGGQSAASGAELRLKRP